MKKNYKKFQTLAYLSVMFIAANQIYDIISNSQRHGKDKLIKKRLQLNSLTDSKSINCLKPEVANVSDTRIFCIMLTQKKTFRTRAKFMTEAWAKYCDNFKLVLLFNNDTSGIAEIDHVLQPPGLAIDTYKNLTHKVLYSLRYVYSNYPDYDWYLKADDDTFVFADNLRWFLSQKNASKPITFGYEFNAFVHGGYLSGGGGYVVSREAVSRLVTALNQNSSFCQISGIEDIDVNRCMKKLGVQIENSTDENGLERFHPISFRSHFRGQFPKWLTYYAKNTLRKGFDCCSETTITFHYVNVTDGTKILRAQEKLRKRRKLCPNGTTNVHEILKQLDL